jgi:integrase
VPGYIEDRWMTKRPDPNTGKKRRTDRWGKGQRYRVAGIPGVKDRSFETLADAKDWLATAQTDAARGDFIDPRRGQMLLRDYIETEWWPNVTVAVSTRTAMWSKIKNHILPHLGQLPLAAIQAQQLRAWSAALKASIGAGTAEVMWIHLGSILSAAVEDKRIARNPCVVSKSAKPVKKADRKARALTAQQVDLIREGLRERYRVMADLGVAAGLRQGEVLGFDPADIDESAGLLHIRRQLLWDPNKPYLKLPKGDKERDVPLSPGLLKRLLKHVETFPPVPVRLPWRGPGGPNGGETGEVGVSLLVTTMFKNPINPNSFNPDVWKPSLVHAGIIPARDNEARAKTGGSGWQPSREWGFHVLRHTYASVQLHAGESVVSLAQWMGHASPVITLKTYAHFMPEAGQRGRAAIDSWLSGDL